uniref:Protocadherin gamma subfamily C, 5 n=1 Tax=Mus musculus TaxID=10090 RepID=A0A0A6YVT4_MOUSE
MRPMASPQVAGKCKPRPTLTGVSLKPRDPARADPKMVMKLAPGPTTSLIQRCCKP